MFLIESENSKAVISWFSDLSHITIPILSYTNHVSHTAKGRAWCCAGGEVLELIMGVTTSRRAKLPMALLTISGGGVGEVILVWECRSAGFGLGNITWRDMCELRGDSLGKGRVIWPSLQEERDSVSKSYTWLLNMRNRFSTLETKKNYFTLLLYEGE